MNLPEWSPRPALLLMLVLLLPAGHAGEETPQGLAELLSDIDAIRKEHGIASVALTLVSRQAILYSGALGYADLATRRSASADTLYRIGSITKAFTSLAILLAAEREQLTLDDGLKALAPDAPLRNPWASTAPVRLSHLLEHTAGLLDISAGEFSNNDPGPLTLEEALAVEPEARVCVWPPGLHASYSNAGAGLAAYALQRTLGQRYEDFVETQLLSPLGMEQAGFFLNAAARARMATGYDTDGKTPIPYWHMIFRPFGGINATPREMGNFVRMLLNDGRVAGNSLLSSASIRRMETPHTTLAARSGLRYGYGLGNYQSVYRGFLFHGHGGDGDGYLSHYAYSRDLGRGYFVVINAFNKTALNRIRWRIQTHLIAGHTAYLPAVARVDERELAALTGSYQAITYRFPRGAAEQRLQKDRLAVILEDGKLYTRSPDGEQNVLLPVNARHFRRRNQPLATIAFIEHQGDLYLQGDFGNYRRTTTTAQRLP